jgi:hypothetical protein
MLKLSIVVAAALLGTAAIAQDANTGSGASTEPAASTPAAPGGATTTTAAPSSDASMTQGSGSVSTTPDMSPAATTSDATPATPGATKNYPRCSKTVTDSCIQGGHRSRRRS